MVIYPEQDSGLNNWLMLISL